MRWTWAEYARLPSEGRTRHEIIDDDLVMTPAPSRRHQRISIHLSTAVHTFVRAHHLGEVYHAPFDVLFADGDFVQPDLVFVRRDRLDVLSERGVEGAPDLVVEIASPSTAQRDRGIKLDRYRLYGVDEYWVVDPESRTVEVWKLGAGAGEPTVVGPGGDLVWSPPGAPAGLALDLAELFDEH